MTRFVSSFHATRPPVSSVLAGIRSEVLTPGSQFPDKILTTSLNGMRQPADTVYTFGDFRLDPSERMLFHGGEPLPLTPKVFDALVLLVENAGHLVEKDEFMKRLWPDTFVGDDTLAQNISLLRKALADGSGGPEWIATVPRRGYRFVAAIIEKEKNGGVDVLTVSTSASQTAEESTGHAVPFEPQVAAALEPMPHSKTLRAKLYTSWLKVSACSLIVGVVAGAITYRLLSSRQSFTLTAEDTFVLADFTNNTGDPIFDETLKQGLRAQLEQSPFMNAVSDQKVIEELRLMQRSPDERLTPALAREVCQRAGSKAVITGTVSSLGTRYVIGLNAFNCHSGDELASEQAEASARETVLRALGHSATNMRKRLGESLASIQKYDVPLEQVTTSSLEALKAYSLGLKTLRAQGATSALPFLRRAVELDPSFAIAYARLGMAYYLLDEISLMVENTRKAYDLRSRVSEHERFYIEANYYGQVTGELEKEIEAYELWRETYPQDLTASHNLADLYAVVGQYEKALQVGKEVLPLQPNNQDIYHEVAQDYLFLNRFDEARDILDQAARRGLQGEDLTADRYMLAFLKADKGAMEKLAAAAEGQRLAEDRVLFCAAATAAFYGQCRMARKLSQRAAESANRAGSSSRAAVHQVDMSEFEARIGCSAAVADAEAALKRARNFYTEGQAGLALAFAGENVRAGKIAVDLRTDSPSNTFLQRTILPAIDATVALNHNKAKEAIETLHAAAAYDLPSAYLRGQAHLALRDGIAAAEEFERITQHPGITGFDPIGALAHLGLARAYSLQGDLPKARAAYRNFLTIWKDADSDLPVLQQANAEFTKLR
jgi:eukaryotic-like serine/threonine-protein kinase